jgi:hypothetical protein
MPNVFELKQRLESFEPRQQAAFCACIAERLFPNYALFSRLMEFGNTQVLRMALDKVWNALAGRGGKVNFETQLERIEPEIPDVEAFDMYGVSPALDAAVALFSTLNQMLQASAEEALNLSNLAQECVATYLEIIAESDLSDEELVRYINTHELMLRELEFQAHVMDSLQADPHLKPALIDQLREQASDEGVSCIGICDRAE